MSTYIHPTAIVDASARLGVEVRIGPYAVIEGDCEIGDYCEARAHAVICGRSILGPHNQIGYGTIIGAEPQDLSYQGAPTRVEMGARNKIREYVTIHRGAREGGVTRLGNDNFIMTGSHVAHDCKVGNNVIMANNVLLAGHVQVGDRVFLGGGAVVHQHVRVGTLAFAGGLSPLNQDLPPYFMMTRFGTISGINRVGLRRAGLSHETRRTLQAAYDVIYRANLNVSQALQELREKFHSPEIAHLVDFIANSKRGIGPGESRGAVEEEQ